MDPDAPAPNAANSEESPADQARIKLAGLHISDDELDGPDLMHRLLADLPLAREVIRYDVENHLQSWFSMRAGWKAKASLVSADGEPERIAVEWEFAGTHDKKDEAFNGLRATGAEITARGVTVIGLGRRNDVGPEVVRFQRYVDWAGLFAQLGLTLNWRVPVADGLQEGYGG